ncbi:putative ribonuclease H-like domain-containing protein [Tanacetum coccineum]|uniref:Ribonuclease H-like domain-containing protein n=1 Tax=Tanacetum coccineum TaxID=301880 RepID=A0ABQ5I9Y3_9ASTR
MKKMYCLVVTDEFCRFSWVSFLATKDETSGILKAFITGIENQINHRVKIIRCDNRTKFKNKEMNQFCEMKEIKREFSVARNPQQNRVAKRKNRKLIKAPRTMLADSKLPTTSWAKAVNTACYVQHKVPKKVNMQVKLGRRQYLVMSIYCYHYGLLIHLSFQVLKSLDDEVADDAGKKSIEDPAKEGDKDDQDLRDEFVREFERLIVQGKEAEININSTNSVSVVSSLVNTAGTKDADVNNTNSIYTASPLVNFDGLSYVNANLPNDPRMPNLEDTGIFGGAYDDEDFVAGGDMNNLESSMLISPIVTTRVHKDHPVEQINRRSTFST